MKRTFIATMTLAALFLNLSLTARAETRKYDYTGFNRISVKITENRNYTTIGGWTVSRGHRIDCTPVVNIVKDNEYGVEMNINDEDYAGICDVSLSGSELEVTVTFDKKSGKAKLDIEFTIHTPVLTELTAGGNCDIKTDGSFETPGDFDLKLSGAADLYGLNLSTSDATIKMSGASGVKDVEITADNRIEFTISGASGLSGAKLRADYLEINTSGASGIGANADIREGEFKVSGASSASVSSLFKDAVAEKVYITVSGASSGTFSGLHAKNATVRVSGSSKANAYASDSLDYKVDMTSSFDYYGKPSSVNSSDSNVNAH